MEGQHIPYRQFGCKDLISFLLMISDTVSVGRCGDRDIVFPVSDQSTDHIEKFVVSQRKRKRNKKKKRPDEVSVASDASARSNWFKNNKKFKGKSGQDNVRAANFHWNQQIPTSFDFNTDWPV